MSLKISITEPKTTKYPMHTHDSWEIMFYIDGEGTMRTECGDFPFLPGTAVIIPPGIMHGSCSKHGFINISVGGDFSHLLTFDTVCCVTDNDDGEGAFFANAIYRNRFDTSQYLASLCNTYVQYLAQKISLKNDIHKSIEVICNKISESAFDSQIDVCRILSESGYAEDYIRMHFKKTVGLTPVKFLAKIRIDHACALIDIYRDTLSLAAIAEKCGYTDYVYFSKRFKEFTSVSPTAFMKRR